MIGQTLAGSSVDQAKPNFGFGLMLVNKLAHRQFVVVKPSAD
jgi:hypothetical protein